MLYSEAPIGEVLIRTYERAALLQQFAAQWHY